MRSAGTVVWLRAEAATLAVRVDDGRGRPMLARGGMGVASSLQRLVAERAPLYEEVADVAVDVDDLTAQDVASRVLAAVAKFRGQAGNPA
jgi:shikimate kinase